MPELEKNINGFVTMSWCLASLELLQRSSLMYILYLVFCNEEGFLLLTHMIFCVVYKPRYVLEVHDRWLQGLLIWAVALLLKANDGACIAL